MNTEDMACKQCWKFVQRGAVALMLGDTVEFKGFFPTKTKILSPFNIWRNCLSTFAKRGNPFALSSQMLRDEPACDLIRNNSSEICKNISVEFYSRILRKPNKAAVFIVY